MARFSNLLAAGISFCLGLGIGLTLLAVGLAKNIEDLIILGGLFLGLLLVLVVFVIISIKKKKEQEIAPLPN